MSWLFEIQRADGSILSAEIKSPEFGDVSRYSRPQDRGETDAGVVFVQDHGRSNLFLEAQFQSLTTCEKSDLLTFFGEQGTLYQCRPFRLTATDGSIAAAISTGQGLSTSGGLTTGQVTIAPTAVYGRVYLDQPGIDFASRGQDLRFDTSMRIRVDLTGAPAIS